MKVLRKGVGVSGGAGGGGVDRWSQRRRAGGGAGRRKGRGAAPDGHDGGPGDFGVKLDMPGLVNAELDGGQRDAPPGLRHGGVLAALGCREPARKADVNGRGGVYARARGLALGGVWPGARLRRGGGAAAPRRGGAALGGLADTRGCPGARKNAARPLCMLSGSPGWAGREGARCGPGHARVRAPFLRQSEQSHEQ